MKFVPIYNTISQESISRLQRYILTSNTMCVMTGAGISTESGIPDYRSKGVGLYANSSYRPMMYDEFLSSVKARKRYWSRNYAAWPKFSSALPNISHNCIADWERKGIIKSLITQNAGSENAIELHGASRNVICLSCGNKSDRQQLQIRLDEANNSWIAEVADRQQSAIAPDGDIQLPDKTVAAFRMVSCEHCSSGILKPNVTFFGANVSEIIVNRCLDMLRNSDKLLVLGSSLTVFSGYRFILEAAKQKIPIAIVNIGKTRADKYATLKVDSNIGDILPRILC